MKYVWISAAILLGLLVLKALWGRKVSQDLINGPGGTSAGIPSRTRIPVATPTVTPVNKEYVTQTFLDNPDMTILFGMGGKKVM